MSETIALTRWALQKHRLSLIVISAMVLFGVLMSFVLAAIEGPGEQRFAITALMITMMPAAVWAIAMFSFSFDRDLMLGESGFVHWLLRMPIAAWKLALVPVALKTIWTSMLWIIFALTVRSICEMRPYLIGPAVGFSAVGIWLMVLTWRPFRNGWWRLLAITICGLMMYGLFVGVLIELEGQNSGRPAPWWLKHITTVGTCGMYALGVYMSVGAIQLARTNALGLIPEKGKATSIEGESAAVGRDRRHRGPRAALVWHDLKKASEFIRWGVVLAVIPATILFTVLMPFSIVGYVTVTVVFAYFGFIASTWVLDHTNKGVIVLPPYLGASPISTATIAWTRMFTIAAIILVVLSISLLVFAGWTLFSENRSTWDRWAGEMAEATGSPSAGFGIAAATILGAFVVLIGRAVAYIWPAYSGRTWVHFLAVALGSLAFMIPICLFIGWFLKQTSWETAEENALYWLTYLPMLVAIWIVGKVIGVVISVAQLRMRQLASAKAIGWMIGGWVVVTFAIALALHLLIPYPQATLLWCLAGVATALPLARVLILPVVLHFGRHL